MIRSFFSIVVMTLIACGPTPPDYGALARHRIEACGEVLTGDELVRRAYDREPRGPLPATVAIPPGTVAASRLGDVDGELVRKYPCAEDEGHARELLADMGFRDVRFVSDHEELLVYDAVDRYGIASAYSIFRCDFVSDVTGRRSGAMNNQGLFGFFGYNGGEVESSQLIRSLAAITFVTGMTHLAEDGFPRLVEGVTLLGSDPEVGPIRHPTGEYETEGIGVCVTWVEPNLWGGCDAVRVGTSLTVVPDWDSRDFQQVAIHSLLDGFYGFAGWCGRRE